MENPLAERPSVAPVSRAPIHLPWLDGLRGIAALWVLLHHVYILVGGSGTPVLAWGKLAVDLFMMLSGFLMAHHYIMRRSVSPWEQPSTWKDFWARRWFRISPLYYVLLIAALLLGPLVGAQRDLIANIWPATATESARYLDASPTNIFLHVTYIFGLLPTYAFRTTLPDWSIGLEMQFYLAFPFIMLAIHRLGPIKAGIALAAFCFALRWVFPGFLAAFPMPSFLPLKLYIFIIGIWIAFALATGSTGRYLLAATVLSVFYIRIDRSIEAVARVLMIFALFYMIMPTPSAVRKIITALLSGRLARFMGHTSYGLYLLHLLIVIPVAGFLSTLPHFVELHTSARLALCTVMVLPPAYFVDPAKPSQPA